MHALDIFYKVINKFEIVIPTPQLPHYIFTDNEIKALY